MSTRATPAPLHVNALVALCVMNHVALSGGRLALALQALRLGVPSVGLGLMLAPFALASTLGALPLGRLVDRVGARVPALCGMAAMAMALAVSAWHPGLATMTMAAAAVGLGYTASLIALQSELARDRDERTRAAGFSAFAIGIAASGGVGPFLAGQCMEHGGVHLAFGMLAALSMAAGAAASLNGRRLLALQRDAMPARAALFSRATLRGIGGLRRVLLSDLLMAFAWNANGFVVPLIGQRRGWSADTVGNLIGAFGAAVLIVRLLPGAWRTRGSDWRTITRALLASGAMLALLPLSTAMPLPYLLEALLGCGLGSSLPSVLALIEAATPAGRRAEVLGLRQAVLGLGAVTTPTVVGALVSAAGLAPAAIGVGGALLAAGTAIAPRARRPAGRPAKAP